VTEVPDAWAPVLAGHRAGAMSAPLTLARLMLADSSARPDRILPALAEADPDLAELSALAVAQSGRLDGLRALVSSGLDPGDTLDDTRALFDRLARDAPEAGVAIYSLGDPALLEAATAELSDFIAGTIPLAGRDVLDFGCGIGRLAAALAGHGARVTGVDLSAEMIAQAERRAGGSARFLHVGPDGAGALGDGSFDLIVAADSFPYLVRAGADVLRRQLADFARLLRPGGDLLVFNWSYRGDLGRDAADAGRFGAEAGFDLLRSGDRPFRIWDGTAFHLRRRLAPSTTVSEEEHWNLWRRDPRATVFQSPAWQGAWTAHLCGRERINLAVREAGRLVAYLPAFLWNDAGLRRLVPIAAGQSDYSDALIDPDCPDAMDRLWSAMLEAGAIWDEILLPDLRPDSPLLGRVPAGLAAADAPHEICPVMVLPAGKTLLEVTGKSQRRKVRHDRHRADTLGGVTVALAAPEEVEAAMDALFALHAARWGREGETGVLADPKLQAFGRAAAHALAEAGLLRIAVVRHHGRIVAVLEGFADRSRGCSYINGVDMSVPGQSFGSLAFACLIEAAIAEGAREFHFLRGEEAYKYSWGAKPIQTVRRVIRRA
jgi:CelD/BcsL family acetyltransferase involved in cellulose biosynthesis